MSKPLSTLILALASACAPRSAPRTLPAPAPVSAEPVSRAPTSDDRAQTTFNQHALPTEDPTSPQPEAPMANPLPPHQQSPVAAPGAGRVPEVPNGIDPPEDAPAPLDPDQARQEPLRRN